LELYVLARTARFLFVCTDRARCVPARVATASRRRHSPAWRQRNGGGATRVLRKGGERDKRPGFLRHPALLDTSQRSGRRKDGGALRRKGRPWLACPPARGNVMRDRDHDPATVDLQSCKRACIIACHTEGLRKHGGMVGGALGISVGILRALHAQREAFVTAAEIVNSRDYCRNS